MSEEAEEAGVRDEDGADGGEATDGKARRPRSRRRLLLPGAIGVAVLAAGAGAYVYFGWPQAGGVAAAPAPAPVREVKPAVFYELPDMTVNLTDTDRRPQYLRVRVALEVSDRATIAQITPLLPRVLDTFQVYLRELRLADLDGSAGIYRLKEELRRRINLAVYPAQVDDVLFKELLIQ